MKGGSRRIKLHRFTRFRLPRRESGASLVHDLFERALCLVQAGWSPGRAGAPDGFTVTLASRPTMHLTGKCGVDVTASLHAGRYRGDDFRRVDPASRLVR